MEKKGSYRQQPLHKAGLESQAHATPQEAGGEDKNLKRRFNFIGQQLRVAVGLILAKAG